MKKLILGITLIIISITAVNAVPVTVHLQGPIVYNQTLKQLSYDIGMLMYNRDLRKDKVDEIVLIITTGGGSVIESVAIYNYLVYLKSAGIKIHTVASAACMSGGMIVLQAGDVRYAYQYTRLMTHAPLIRVYAPKEEYYTTTDIEETLSDIDQTNENMVTIFANRMKIDRRRLYKYFMAKPFFFGPEKAYQLGFIDKIIYDPTTLYDNSPGKRADKKLKKAIDKYEETHK